MLPSGEKSIFPKPLDLTTRNNEVRKASISRPPYAQQGKNFISVYVLINVIKLASGEGQEIKFLSQTLL